MLRMLRRRNKNVLRLDRSDDVPTQNSTSTCSGTVLNCVVSVLFN